jgi:hypothetical protein
MRARLALAWLLALTPTLTLLQGCGAARGPGTDAAADPPTPAAVPDSGATQPVPDPFLPSAPDELVSEGIKSQRRFVVGDMIRAGVVSSVEQGPPGILRVGIGPTFHSHGARGFFFGKLASAYHTWTVEGQPLVIELWEGGGKVGEYTVGTFLVGPEHTTPRQCPPDATTGLCSPAGQEAQRIAARAAAETAVRTANEAPPARRPMGELRPGFQFGLGGGAGATDWACDGCDFESEVGVSGFLSVGRTVLENTMLGVEVTGFTKSESASTTQVYSLMAQVTRYLSVNSGLFLRAGAGLVGYRRNSDLRDLSASGPGFTGRLGYEFGRGRFVVVPYVGLVRTFAGVDFEADGEDIGFNAALSNLQFGLSVGAR